MHYSSGAIRELTNIVVVYTVIYSNNSTIELSKIRSTKGKARKQELYRWAKLISASTWEEVREESEGNHYMEKMRDEMIKMSRDESE